MAIEELQEPELERYKRFQAEQYRKLGTKVLEIESLLKNFSPSSPLAPKTRDLLARQVEQMFNKLKFLECEIIKIKKHVGIKDG